MTRKKIERRYLVLKLSDIDRYLSVSDRHTIHLIGGIIERKRREEKRPPVVGLYIDRSFPIYDQVEAATLHWLNGEEGDPQLAYIRNLERKLSERDLVIHRLQDENFTLVGENNRLKKA